MDRLRQEAQKAEEMLAMARLELREQTQQGVWGSGQGLGAGEARPGRGAQLGAPAGRPTLLSLQRRRSPPG